MTVRCAVEGCEFEFSSSAGEGRQVAEEHRALEHPELRAQPRSRRGRWDRESALAACLAYVTRENREHLTHADLAGEPDLPSTPTIIKLFGGTVGLAAALDAARGLPPAVNAGPPAEAAAPVEALPCRRGPIVAGRSRPRDGLAGVLAAAARLLEVCGPA